MSKKFAPDPTASLRRVQSVRTGISLSDIKNVPVESLTINKGNALYFKRETTEYFQQLREDIEKRGVLVPLLTKKDGTLLAGHNRLRIAKEIGLRFIPVQVVQEELTERQELECIINDNLLRRHLTLDDRIHLYKQLFPEFDTVLQKSKRGGDKKSTAYKNQTDNVSLKSQASSTKQSNGTTATSIAQKATTINELATKIASTTGQKVSTVEQQLNRSKRSAKAPAQVKISPSKNQTDNVSLIYFSQQSSVQTLAHVDTLLEYVRSASPTLQAKVRKRLEVFLAELSGGE
jgi:ParB-like nuclease domain